jgi:peptidoglycan LD-endopeptidase LytH
MLRLLLALLLLTFLCGISFYAGRVTAPREASLSRPPIATKSRSPDLNPPGDPPQVAKAIPQSPLPDGVDPLAAPTPEIEIGTPIAGLKSSQIQDTYEQSRASGQRLHEALDIMSPRGTPVLAVTSGLIKKLFHSEPGGITIYQFDSSERYCFYYAHLDRYEDGLREGQLVKRGNRIGYVGSTGNANPDAPHLHFAIFELGPDKSWWKGKPLNPYPVLMRSLK